ncbi:hypothetical protein TNCT_261461 [Trichonephila clavata]|uniref:Uncharacterized protein n=1 Tax=Trichonephila clavata TaxID=2740835 RepID=A0A8X6I085_TRICU|nr:hypothetical protein TNCT_261461 [Trichonephila clavata]
MTAAKGLITGTTDKWSWRKKEEQSCAISPNLSKRGWVLLAEMHIYLHNLKCKGRRNTFNPTPYLENSNVAPSASLTQTNDSEKYIELNVI